MTYFFDEYDLNLDETKYSDKISQVSLCGKKPKPNVDEGYIFLILVLGTTCLLILFVIMIPSPDLHINFSHMPQPKNSI